jgi:histidyl-tRNA synthetase
MIQKVKGTYDVSPKESASWRHLENHIHRVMEMYQYTYVRTPIFEYYEVFHRHNEQSDMVKKETYDFYDRGERQLTLRPEGTAGVLRSFIEEKRYLIGHHEKLYYMGPNYRYERPQKGRFREFYQVGVEVIGEKHPTLDADIIGLAYHIVSSLGIKDVSIHLNYLGDSSSRKQYQDALVTYLKPYAEQLSEDSKKRLETNPLRILDSKIESDHHLLKDAPTLSSFLTDDQTRYFNQLKSLLNQLNIPFVEDPKLVRGLDYYGHTVFEIHADMEGFGSQNALGGGGRYDALISEMGGPNVSGMGFAFGMERLLLAIALSNKEISSQSQYDLIILPQDNEYSLESYVLYTKLRGMGFKVYFDYGIKNMKTQLKFASLHHMSFAFIIDEVYTKTNVIHVKDLKTFTQETLPFDEAITRLKQFKGE